MPRFLRRRDSGAAAVCVGNGYECYEYCECYEYYVLAAALSDAGLSDAAIDAIFYRNADRFFSRSDK